MGNLESARIVPPTLTCKGSYALGSACGACERCMMERAVMGAFVTHEEALEFYVRQRTSTITVCPKHGEIPGPSCAKCRIAPMDDLVQAVRELINANKYPYLLPEFLEAMNDIGKYGFQKYGPNSFHAHRLAGHGRDDMANRGLPSSYIQHAKEHGEAYLNLVPHDHFGTEMHQLAASAFNVMMEAYFSMRREK